jgi:hypothetical protein
MPAWHGASLRGPLASPHAAGAVQRSDDRLQAAHALWAPPTVLRASYAWVQDETVPARAYAETTSARVRREEGQDLRDELARRDKNKYVSNKAFVPSSASSAGQSLELPAPPPSKWSQAYLAWP